MPTACADVPKHTEVDPLGKVTSRVLLVVIHRQPKQYNELKHKPSFAHEYLVFVGNQVYLVFSFYQDS
jgi:hypothetical protein